MKVMIDPNVKKLFFDRIIEQNGHNPNEALKWIENVAFGEDTIVLESQQEAMIKKIQELEEEIRTYKYYDKKNSKTIDSIRSENRQYRKHLRGVDEEIEGYIREINDMKQIMTGSKLDAYAGHYDDWDDDPDIEDEDDFEPE